MIRFIFLILIIFGSLSFVPVKAHYDNIGYHNAAKGTSYGGTGHHSPRPPVPEYEDIFGA